MRTLFVAGRELSYARNDVLVRALRRVGTVEALGPNRMGSLSLNSLLVFRRALPRLLARRYDLIFVGFYGHLLMLPVSTLTTAPIVFDAFLSTYDTLCFDRQTFAPGSPGGRLAFWLDQTTTRRAQRVLLDTPQHVEFFRRTFGLPRERFDALPVGCNEDLFYPRPEAGGNNTIRVLYYTTFLPLHGADIVVRAAAHLRREAGLRFTLLGAGPDYARVRRLADELQADNVDFAPPVPVSALPECIARSTICLGGHFGTSGKAARVIPGKVYQILAMARPLVAADSPANRDLLTHGVTACLCPPANPEALAEVILQLQRDPSRRAHLAGAGRVLYQEQCSEQVITRKLAHLIEQLMPPASGLS